MSDQAHHDAGPQPTGPLPRIGARRWLVIPAASLLLLGACGSDGEDDEPDVNSVPESTEQPADTQAPPSSGQEPAPSEDPDTDGADPGRDGDQVDPPGGTTPDDDPGGFDGGNGDNGTNPDTED
jgi:hypothetical protein